MPNLRDYFFSDLNTFLNQNEFAESATIDGDTQTIVIDEDKLKKRVAEYGGITTGMILYFIPVSAFSRKPKIGDTQTFNNKLMYVDDVNESHGIYEVVLTQNRGE